MWRIALLVAGIVPGCVSSVVAVADYDQSCSVPADCSAVADGDVCQPCRCATKALRTSELPRFKADSESAAAWCGSNGAVACSPCRETVAACESGKCGVSMTP